MTIKKNFVVTILGLALLFSVGVCCAEKYHFNTFYKVKSDTGYSELDNSSKSDVHDGWKLGEFVLEGFTSTANKNGELYFIKNYGDKISLTFNLFQDIDRLNGNENLSIANEEESYDKEFGIEKSDFGQGLFVIRHTTAEGQNNIIPYKNFLLGIKENASTNVMLLEEGDYAFALDYSVRKKNLIFDDMTFYKICSNLKVRNGNCMVYLFDAGGVNQS